VELDPLGRGDLERRGVAPWTETLGALGLVRRVDTFREGVVEALTG